ncbi:MAG: 50S ribosomal protein L19 [Candidatus Terrybacteria bacterium RIFCSPLOWO2_01_FULL_44_24]|uniref:Large ribosomal subunit protein bL19 n=1 Tax=Candidatus Terrybacteria bacterium RIFCSPHIGHO2_01_FULL_43_35 TaxID=1802361 RepID=A0A1G2PE08_9BACT|nr:MAG: 50S ribosomal protein L19 [Candidatus Terrybacteria bacterium RIFCSPHIGHO2_01_FULL_43_35]OHA50131.1 MAG: 50S ribosomal protein L19 [Candidatus Terrybacteria bacterium RIFCSPHIGHO2_02_FULL_43_14]OHA51954.1 MAG: 50S ribosomal protein L19 [Candidatus Terrybacteria bacterium RIFCSPLOWO2_01_FULL_44_24]
MNKTIEKFNKTHEAKKIPDVRSGDTVRVVQMIKEGDKQRPQAFEGLVIALKHGRGINGMMTVRKISFGVGVERIFPLHAPTLERIEVLRRAKVRRAKLFFVRGKSGRKARKMRGDIVPPETGTVESAEENV